jgi:uncharacterized protein YxeA
MKMFLVSVVKTLVVAMVSLFVFGCASSQPTRYVKIAGSGTNQVLVPVTQSQKAPKPQRSKWNVWNPNPVQGVRIIWPSGPADPVPAALAPNSLNGEHSFHLTIGQNVDIHSTQVGYYTPVYDRFGNLVMVTPNISKQLRVRVDNRQYNYTTPVYDVMPAPLVPTRRW